MDAGDLEGSATDLQEVRGRASLRKHRNVSTFFPENTINVPIVLLR